MESKSKFLENYEDVAKLRQSLTEDVKRAKNGFRHSLVVLVLLAVLLTVAVFNFGLSTLGFVVYGVVVVAGFFAYRKASNFYDEHHFATFVLSLPAESLLADDFE